MVRQRTAEEMREYQKQRRARLVTPTDVTPTDVTPKHVCNHVPRPVPEGNRVLTCSRSYGPPISWKVPLPEPETVVCPCCGKQWTCKRPDIQSPYCLKCDMSTPENWRKSFPYKRPQMNAIDDISGYLSKRPYKVS